MLVAAVDKNVGSSPHYHPEEPVLADAHVCKESGKLTQWWGLLKKQKTKNGLRMSRPRGEDKND